MKRNFSGPALILLSCLFVSNANATPGWYDSSQDSCDTVCHAHGEEPVVIGIYHPQDSNNSGGAGKPYYLCAADAGNEGMRPGYNLPPYWNHVCYVPWNGKEQPIVIYKCFCSRGIPQAGH